MKIPKASALILGMLLERPMSPYEMVHLSESINPDFWFSIAEPTFYVYLRRLAKDNLITGQINKQGGMHEKTIYSLSESGRKAVINTFLDFLASDELDPEMLRLVILFLGYLEPKEVYPCLGQRLQLLQVKRDTYFRRLTDKDFTPPLNIRIIVQHTFHILENECRVTQEIIDVLERDPDFHTFSQLFLENMKMYRLEDRKIRDKLNPGD